MWKERDDLGVRRWRELKSCAPMVSHVWEEEDVRRVRWVYVILKYKCPTYSFCEAQASKAQCTPHENCYNSQTGPNMTKVEKQKVIF